MEYNFTAWYLDIFKKGVISCLVSGYFVKGVIFLPGNSIFCDFCELVTVRGILVWILVENLGESGR